LRQGPNRTISEPPRRNRGPPQNFRGRPQNNRGPPQTSWGPPRGNGGPPRLNGGPPRASRGLPRTDRGAPRKIGGGPRHFRGTHALERRNRATNPGDTGATGGRCPTAGENPPRTCATTKDNPRGHVLNTIRVGDFYQTIGNFFWGRALGFQLLPHALPSS
jgi:hypothetical protein